MSGGLASQVDLGPTRSLVVVHRLPDADEQRLQVLLDELAD